jgi:hypothetical protein
MIALLGFDELKLVGNYAGLAMTMSNISACRINTVFFSNILLNGFRIEFVLKPETGGMIDPAQVS